MTPQTWGFGYRRKTFPMNFSKILRAGFEPATYGCLIYHNYSPPLYQLSYRRLDEWQLQNSKHIYHQQQCPWTSYTYLGLVLIHLLILAFKCQCGDVAQMVERSLSMWEVGGSIPPVSKLFFSTKPFRGCGGVSMLYWWCCFVYTTLLSKGFHNVRMAEWSKAPDSRLCLAPYIGSQCENSGPRMRAWVQIPLLTTIIFIRWS